MGGAVAGRTAGTKAGVEMGVTPGTDAGVVLPGVETVLERPAAVTDAGSSGCAALPGKAGTGPVLGNLVVPDHFS